MILFRKAAAAALAVEANTLEAPRALETPRRLEVLGVPRMTTGTKADGIVLAAVTAEAAVVA